MITDIVNIFFDLLPELILGAGPFCVFKGMGTDKDSGKLLFKKIYSDGELTITEDSTSLDLTAVGGALSAIDTCEIAFGNASGDGLTSSTFKVCSSSETIFGISVLGGINNCKNCSGVSANETSMIVGGGKNCICSKVSNSVIASGYKNYLLTSYSDAQVKIPVCSSAVIGGSSNFIQSHLGQADITSLYSTIISSSKSYICGDYSTIISSCNTRGIRSYGQSKRGTLIGMGNSTGGINGSFNNVSFISSSVDVSLYSSGNSNNSGDQVTSIGGNRINMLNGKQLTSFGYQNFIYGKNSNTSIISGKYNCAVGSRTTILNGYINCICEQPDRFVLENYRMRDNIILNGKCNRIFQNGNGQILDPPADNSPFPQYSFYGLCNSIIAHGYCNYLINSNSAILNGRCNIIRGAGDITNSTILNGYKNCITDTKASSMIISGKLLTMSASNSIMFSAGNKNDSGNFGWSEQSMEGDSNSMFQIKKNDLIRTGFYNKIKGDRNSTFNIYCGSGGQSAGYYLVICTSEEVENSSIITLGDSSSDLLFSYQGINGPPVSAIIGTVKNSSVIGGSSIFFKPVNVQTDNVQRTCSSQNSVIIGQMSRLTDVDNSSILAGTFNRIDCAKNSVIIGGYQNVINGFKCGNITPTPEWLVAKNSVILGGYNNYITSKGELTTVIIGGSHSSTSSRVTVPNLDSFDKFSAYSNGTCYPGITETKSTLSSITVCNGILIAWS